MTQTADPPHGLPRELQFSGEGDHGFIFLNDHAVPVTRSHREDGSLVLTVGQSDPEASQQLADWLAWQSDPRSNA